jgi:hypothetical protein
MSPVFSMDLRSEYRSAEGNNVRLFGIRNRLIYGHGGQQVRLHKPRLAPLITIYEDQKRCSWRTGAGC